MSRAPGWERLAPEIAEMFDWTHMLHRQICDVWTDDRISPTQKDAKVAEVVRYYKSRHSPAFSSKPKDMSRWRDKPTR